MRFKWDKRKSDICKRKKGNDLGGMQTVIKNEIGGGIICDDPEQFLSIGFSSDCLVSVAYEFREDKMGTYTWIITYWKTTKQEVKRFGLCQKRRK